MGAVRSLFGFGLICSGFLCSEIVCVDRLTEDHKPLKRKLRSKVQDHIDRGDQIFIPAEFRRELVL